MDDPRCADKERQTHEVPLSDIALAILKDAIGREGREDRNMIFGGSADSSFSGWSRAKIGLDARAAYTTGAPLAPWRLHDLRRTAATRMADLSEQPHVIEAVLNHVSGSRAGVAGIYNRALYSAEKRQALDRWAAQSKRSPPASPRAMFARLFAPLDAGRKQ